MILVIGGTADAREIASRLVEKGAGVLVSTATRYGARLVEVDGVEAIYGRLDGVGWQKLIKYRQINTVVDSSHPYACEVSDNAAKACAKSGVKYIRFARPPEKIPEGPLVVPVGDYREAAVRAFEMGSTVLATTGSKTAEIFISGAVRARKRVVFRVMPDPEVIKSLLNLDISPSDIVAAQGPFSEEMNIALLKHFQADVLVAKESGKAGGFGEKVSAAEKAGVPLIVVKRPPEPAGAVYSVREAVALALG